MNFAQIRRWWEAFKETNYDLDFRQQIKRPQGVEFKSVIFTFNLLMLY